MSGSAPKRRHPRVAELMVLVRFEAVIPLDAGSADVPSAPRRRREVISRLHRYLCRLILSRFALSADGMSALPAKMEPSDLKLDRCNKLVNCLTLGSTVCYFRAS